MIKPHELESDSGRLVWETLSAAAVGDTSELRRLIEQDPALVHAEYWYTQPLHFAVREGHLDGVRFLLEAGAVHDETFIGMARDRGYESIERLLEEARQRKGRVAPGQDHPIHRAAATDDLPRVQELLDGDATLVNCADRAGRTPLHCAVLGSARNVVSLLLDRGADIHALAGKGPRDIQAIDLAIWSPNPVAPARGDFQTARLLLARGAACDLAVASALGDIARVTAILDQDPDRIREMRAYGRRALTAAVECKRANIARLLLDRGADPTWPEAGADRGAALRMASGADDREMVELLLAHGADPNSGVDSGGSATWAASPELRPLLIAHGGKLDPYDLVWADEDDEVMRRVMEDPHSAETGCGGVFTAVCTRGKRDLLVRLLDAGIRVPPVLTACRGYLLEDIEMFRMLLDSGMNPDLPNWQRQTFLHDLCRGGKRGQIAKQLTLASILLDAGASISAREEEYRSTPLAWAARTDMPEMVEFLLARGAPANLPDDPAWATPLAWAERRGHAEVAEILRKR